MSTRLDRLFLLLDQGTNNVTRKAAALQLGEVQKLHPHEFNNLLIKVKSYLQSSSWETRIAASLAVEAIIKNIPPWFPVGVEDKDEQTKDSKIEYVLKDDRMCFNFFDINTVIKCGQNLLGSEGSEYDTNIINCDNLASNNFKEKLTLQRRLLNKKLGLDIAEQLNLGINSADIVSNYDLSQSLELNGRGEGKRENGEGVEEKKNLKDIINKCSTLEMKRKAQSDSLSENSLKKIKTQNEEKEEEFVNDLAISSEEWPLESFSDGLMSDLFNPSWEIRHGAATGLREIVKIHGKSGGRWLNAPKSQMDNLNQLWLEDLALRLICVLALDKFGDFVSDQVVAPVRETCAQTLGSVFNIMSKERILKAIDILLKLLSRPEWETRHGGLLGLKYLLAIRQDLTQTLLPIVFDAIFNCLKDPIDDVSAVAAAALVPVKDSLIESLPDKIPVIIDFLWDALNEIDDLTSSTSNILMLLSSLLTDSSISFIHQFWNNYQR